MKKINILVVLGIFVLLVGIAQPVHADAWNYTNNPSRFQLQFVYGAKEAAHLTATLGKFNGLLIGIGRSAIDHDRDNDVFMTNKQAQIEDAGRNLAVALNELNSAIREAYPTLSEEEQITVREAYSSLGSYLEDLTAETNSVFGREVFRIEYSHPDSHPDFIWLPTPHGE